MRKSIKVTVLYNGNNSYTLNTSYSKAFVFNGSPEGFAKFLMKLKVSDNASKPKTIRNRKYMDMVNDIISGKDNIIWIWKHMLDKLNSTIYIEEIKMKKEVVLNYINSEIDTEKFIEELINTNDVSFDNNITPPDDSNLAGDTPGYDIDARNAFKTNSTDGEYASTLSTPDVIGTGDEEDISMDMNSEEPLSPTDSEDKQLKREVPPVMSYPAESSESDFYNKLDEFFDEM